MTKGVSPIELSQLSKKNEYGITLVSLDEDFREKFEPNTTHFAERIAALRNLHDAGCYTWVSIEPYPTPNIIEQNLEDILEAVGFVDKMKYAPDCSTPKELSELIIKLLKQNYERKHCDRDECR